LVQNRGCERGPVDDCADFGIIKFDLLGLGMMAVLEESLALILEGYDEEVDLAHLPTDDPAVYAAIQQARRKEIIVSPCGTG
jgi:DNA polymerase III alpha subunit